MIRPAPDRLQVGSVLLRTGTLTPLSVPLYLRTFGRDWQFIENSGGRVLDQGFHRMGWDFFLRAGSIRGYAVGSGESSIMRATLNLLAEIQARGFNCAQISGIVVKRFLGVRYVRVEAHSRHLQPSSMLDSMDERKKTIAATAWSIA